MSRTFGQDLRLVQADRERIAAMQAVDVDQSNEASEPAVPAPRRTAQVIWKVLLQVAVAASLVAIFSVIEHDPIFADAKIDGVHEADIRDEYIDQLKGGNAFRQAGLIAFGLMGAGFLVATRKQPWNINWAVATPLLLLLAWTALSACWSGQLLVTGKRLVVLGCIVVGSAGFSRYLGPRGLLLNALITLLAFILGSLAIDVALGGRPWEGGDYRFGGTLHPNAQANYCGVMCLAAVCLPVGFGKRWITRAIFLFGVGLILLTQSRTGLGSLLVALLMVWVIRLPELLKWAGAAVVVGMMAAIFIAWNSVGDGLRNQTVDTVLLGRTDQAKSLTGRVPLWEELIDYADDRPITGYGYEGFWSARRIASIMKSQNWTMQNAHNSYLEVLLQLGIVGLVLAVWFLIASLVSLNNAYRITRSPGFAFAFGLVVYGMANSTLESLFVRIRYAPVLALTGVLIVTLSFPRSEEGDDEESLDKPLSDLDPPALRPASLGNS